MILENKKTRDIGDAKNAPCSVTGTSKLTEKKYSIHIPFEVMDFWGNDYVIVSPKRFSRIKAFRYLLSRHIDGLENGELKRNYISQLCKDWKWTRPTVVSFLKTLHEMNVIGIKLILQVKWSLLIRPLLSLIPAKRSLTRWHWYRFHSFLLPRYTSL